MPDFLNHKGGPYPLLDSTEKQTAKLHTYIDRKRDLRCPENVGKLLVSLVTV